MEFLQFFAAMRAFISSFQPDLFASCKDVREEDALWNFEMKGRTLHTPFKPDGYRRQIID